MTKTELQIEVSIRLADLLPTLKFSCIEGVVSVMTTNELKQFLEAIEARNNEVEE